MAPCKHHNLLFYYFVNIWQEPETDEGAQIDDVLKGTCEAITMGALLDKISQSKENAEGRTEEQKLKAAKVRVRLFHSQYS